MREEACLFGSARSLVGVITDPAGAGTPSQLPGVILLNSGIVHRVGLNRLHVKLARNLAARGFVTMRFDFSGIGDSLARQDNLPMRKSSLSETQEAMNYLGATRGIDRFVLMGICSGAGIALKAACVDPRVVGVVPVNSRGSLSGPNADPGSHLRNRALLRHYRRIAFSSSFQVNNWLRALTGKVNYRMFVSATSSCLMSFFSLRKQPSFAGVGHPFQSDVRSLLERGVRLLFIHAEGDEGLDFVQMVLGNEVKQWSNSKEFRLEIIEGANHTFALLWTQEKLLELIYGWTEQIGNAARGNGRSPFNDRQSGTTSLRLVSR